MRVHCRSLAVLPAWHLDKMGARRLQASMVVQLAPAQLGPEQPRGYLLRRGQVAVESRRERRTSSGACICELYIVLEKIWQELAYACHSTFVDVEVYGLHHVTAAAEHAAGRAFLGIEKQEQYEMVLLMRISHLLCHCACRCLMFRQSRCRKPHRLLLLLG